jgi:glycosyltransferase involved in cell wall biosynthesis
MKPKVSVIIPVYNGERYLHESIESILDQTFKDFELLLINDGSTDNSLDIINSYSDDRIRVLNNKTNTGLASVRNKGIAEARGEYIAWLDADDMSLPERLGKQVQLLDKHAGIGLCGTHARVMGSGDSREWRFPHDPEDIFCDMLFYDPLVTSSVMIRKNILVENKLQFNATYLTAEDYDLWERVSRHCLFSNIPEILTLYRVHDTQTSSLKDDNYKKNMDWSIQIRILKMLDVDPGEKEREIHQMLSYMQFQKDKHFLTEAETWLKKLKRANAVSNYFPGKPFNRMLGSRWLAVLLQAGTSRYYKLVKIVFSDFHDWKSKWIILLKRIAE